MTNCEKSARLNQEYLLSLVLIDKLDKNIEVNEKSITVADIAVAIALGYHDE